MDQEALKQQAGVAAAGLVKNGDIVGLGTGSTVKYTILELARRVKEESLQMKGIPTSIQSEELAKEGGIQLTTLDDHPLVDVTIDGADEFDGEFSLIKGGGGALTREKIVAFASKRMVVVADESKEVEKLGSTFALPVEVIRLGLTPVKLFLERAGAEVTVREGGDYETDNGNPILDAKFSHIEDPFTLEEDLSMFPGVVECGLFLGLCSDVFVARADGVHALTRS